MSVTLEKRRKVAELENFERRIRQEKRRLLSELESLERPFRNARATGWIRDFSSDIAGGSRAVYDAASSRAPIWFFLIAAIILVGGGGLVGRLALNGAPAPRADGATLRQAETPTTPARIEQPKPAPVKEIAQAADAAPSSALSVSAASGLTESPAPSTSDSKDLRERLLEAQSVAGRSPVPLPEPLPEPLPPPKRADVPAAAPAYGAGAASMRDAVRRKTAFDDAPPVDAAAPVGEAPSARESPTEEKPANEGRRTQCLVKVDGSVLFDRGCTLRQPGRSTFTFDAGGDDVVLTLERGRTWTASLGGRSLGKVYRTGNCWGRRREVYICAKGA